MDDLLRYVKDPDQFGQASKNLMGSPKGCEFAAAGAAQFAVRRLDAPPTMSPRPLAMRQ